MYIVFICFLPLPLSPQLFLYPRLPLKLLLRYTRTCARTHTHTYLLSPCTQSLNCKRICRRLTSDRFRLDNLAVSSSLAKTGSPSWSRRLPEVLHLEEASLRVPLSTLACQPLLSLCESCLVCSETVSSTYDTEAAPTPWNLNNIITQH